MDSEKPWLWSIVIYEIWSHHWCTWLCIYTAVFLPHEYLNSRLWSIKLLVYVKCNHLHKYWSMPNSRPLTRFFKWKWSSLLWSDHHLFRHLLPRLNFQFAHSWLVFPFVGYFHAKNAPFWDKFSHNTQSWQCWHFCIAYIGDSKIISVKNYL